MGNTDKVVRFLTKGKKAQHFGGMSERMAKTAFFAGFEKCAITVGKIEKVYSKVGDRRLLNLASDPKRKHIIRFIELGNLPKASEQVKQELRKKTMKFTELSQEARDHLKKEVKARSRIPK